MTDCRLNTTLIHHPYRAPDAFDAIVPPTHKASTILFRNMHDARTRQWLDKSGYTYGLHGTPTTYTLEERLCTLEGGSQCLLTPSGLAAISTVGLALLGQGDHVLIPDNAYGPNRDFAAQDLARFGITHDVYDPMNPAELAARITPQTRLVWLEAAGSVTMEFPDLIAQVRICRERGVLCALDNTWGAGLAFAPFDLLGDGSLGVDISAHALTKYPSGGGDVLMGSIITRDAALHQRLKLAHMRLGVGVGANDVEAILRALPSTALRYAAHDRAARALAAAFERQSGIVTQVLHPALPTSPGHEHWRAVCGAADAAGGGAAAGLFSIIIDSRFSRAQVDAFCDALQLFGIGYSWGGPMSLVMGYDLNAMRVHPRPHLKAGHIVRFCVGLEDLRDLQADIAQAFEAAFGCRWVPAA